MNLASNILVALQVALLLYAAMTDVAARIIPNQVCLMLAVLRLVTLPFGDMQQLLIVGFYISVATFVFLFILYSRGWMGGGDVKLLAALAIGLSFAQSIQLLTVIVLTGGVLALAHLMLRTLPAPDLAPAGSSLLRRVYAVERWRHLRQAPLPYGIAIACGGIYSLLHLGVQS